MKTVAALGSIVNTIWQFATASAIKFGRGSRHQLVDELKRRSLARPMLVTDQVLLGVPLVCELVEALGQDFQICVFEDGKAEPAIDVAEKAIDQAASHGCDSIVGIGGGSNLDVAKVVACVVKHGGGPRNYFGFDCVPGPVLPMFAMPTTAGTGSEVSHSAVLTDVKNQVKVSTLSSWLRPTVAIVDPALTDSCPAKVTGESGIDALVHAVEAYTNKHYSEMEGVDPQARAYEGSYPFTKVIASEAIRLVGRSLVEACQSGGNEQARDDMALAAMLAGMAFSNSGVGIVHALEYPIGALTHCGHGEGNGLLLPHVMRYNLKVRQQEFSDIAAYLGVDTRELSPETAAEAAVGKIVELQHATGIRTRLSELGMNEPDVAGVAEKAFEIKRLMDINARPPSVDDLVGILSSAL